MLHLVLFAILLPYALSVPFPDRYAFFCIADRADAAQGYKADGWHVFAESEMPADTGRGTNCQENTTAGTLSCTIQWLKSGNSTAFNLINGDNTATGTLITEDGVAHAFTDCNVRAVFNN